MNEASNLPFSPACERNRQPILDAMRPRLPSSGNLLEIGSGTGQHAVFMAPRLPGLVWQPSDHPDALPGLQLRLRAEASPNVLPAISLDVMHDPWPAQPMQAVYAANVSHIMSWAAVLAMLEGVGASLEPGGCFFLYGPFVLAGQPTAPSNLQFHESLRQRDPDMGLRELAALESAANRHHLLLEEQLQMPANNLLLVWRKQPAAGEANEQPG
jgi:hypothetical protein